VGSGAGKDQLENAAACLSGVSCDALHDSSSIEVIVIDVVAFDYMHG
jgi:hypothetical protein